MTQAMNNEETNTRYKLFVFSITILFLCLFFPDSQAEAKAEFFSVNTADQPPYSTNSDTGLYDQIILRLFKEMNIQVQINHLPSARSIENLDLGLDDAEYARIEGLSNHYPHIRIVNERLFDFAFTAFSKNGNIFIENWEALEKYNVAFLKGWKIYEVNVNKTKSLQVVSSEEELFSMLVNDRVDVILYEQLRGFDYMQRKKISGIHALQKPLAIRGMYLYLHEKHEKLIPEIEARLQAMKISGEYQRILDSFAR
jgi:polar amino acid transport system substrate-binding protein